MTEAVNTVVDWAVNTGVKVVIALIILVISFLIINWLGKKIEKMLLSKNKLDETLTKTISYAARIALKILVICALIGYLGIETGSITAVIGSLGVCAGLAVNGALSNLAGGILILITRPFKIGDYISAQGTEGTVEEIRIINTKIVTVDNQVVYLPNGSLSSGVITNLSEKDLRRVDLEYSVAGNDPELVKTILLGLAAADGRILKDPAATADICDFGAGNGMKITFRSYCKSADYWAVRFSLLKESEKAFAAADIVVPFNQLDVHIKNN